MGATVEEVAPPEAHSQEFHTIQLEGAPNFRDIGGMTSADGRIIVKGRLFRSGQLGALTVADHAAIAPLGIRVVFDLRTDGEREETPLRWIGPKAPEMVAAPMLFGSAPGNLRLSEMIQHLAAQLRSEDDARKMMRRGFAQLTETGRAQMGAVMRRLANDEGPAVVCCTAGKDRTGMFIAVFLTVLGIPRALVVADFLRSNAAMVSVAASTSITKLVSDPGVVGPLMHAEAAYLDAAFRSIDENWGSFETYRRKGLELSDEHLERLKGTFLR